MPLEIKELHIKVNVQSGQQPATSTSSSSSNGGQNQEALLQLCVEKVLEILEEKAER